MDKVFVSHGDLILDKIYDDNLKLLKQDGGGCNWNDLYNLSLMGEKCYAIGSRGDDDEGLYALSSLKNAGVNTDYIITEQKSTNVMNIIVPSSKLQDNSVIHSWYSPITYDYTMNFSTNLPNTLPNELKSSQVFVILDKFQPANLDFIENLSDNCVLCLDIGHIRFFEHFTKQYMSKFLQRAKFVQLNDTTTSLLFERIGVKNELEFFNLFNFDLLIITKGKRGASFLFKENNEIKELDKTPEIIAEAVDTSGAGDAFFSKVLRQYAYTEKIDNNFVDETFKSANELSREVLSQVGSRINKGGNYGKN